MFSGLFHTRFLATMLIAKATDTEGGKTEGEAREERKERKVEVEVGALKLQSI